MREVRLTGVVQGVGPDDVFAAVTDVEKFPALCEDVRAVHVDNADGGQRSAWTVKFRGGVLEWTEHDDIDPATRTMSIHLIDGDFKAFEAEWKVEVRDGRTTVAFTAGFDLGIAALRAVLEPIAAKSLRKNLSEVLRNLFGSDVQFGEE